jgi:hypothetical protein
MEGTLPRLSSFDFATLFGTTVDRLSEKCLSLIAAGNWNYRVFTGSERDNQVLELLQRSEQRTYSVVANQDKTRWQVGWSENLNAFRDQNGSLEALVPKYIRPGMPVRLFQQFVQPEDPDFELHWYEVFRYWFFSTHLQGFNSIFEFGCGSGFNVAELAKMFPATSIHGLDWAEPSVEIVDRLREVHGLNTKGHMFDFFAPDQSLDLSGNTAVLTIGALEQTGPDFNAFLDFLLIKKPRCCFHIEPIHEWYDPGDLVDYTGMKAHEARNFWRGFPARLLELEKEGRVKIHKTKRAHVGGLALEGYSQFIWSPA